jgi:hypothetical protein
MPFLIDGHNLIGRLPDIRLDDPDDEVKLVLCLRRFCARTGKRAVVVFDHGLPGGVSTSLSGGGVQVVFASAGRTADGILCERIRRWRNPTGWAVVTSDRRVIDVARAKGARVMRAEAFARQLALPAEGEGPEKPDAHLSADEVAAWMALFREEPED